MDEEDMLQFMENNQNNTNINNKFDRMLNEIKNEISHGIKKNNNLNSENGELELNFDFFI